MAILFSRKFKIAQTSLCKLGIFNPTLDSDSHFFINFCRLKQTSVPEFQGAYLEVNSYFSKIGLLLFHATSQGDKFYRAAIKRFNFNEVNGINLGFSTGKHGAGFGSKLRDIIIGDAFQIIKSGTTDPEIFHLVSLFEENVGPDRLSDMLAGLLKERIIKYTKRMMHELDVTPNRYTLRKFIGDIPENPYKPGTPILLLPQDILHELPIAKDWFDIDRVCRENEAIKAEINSLVSAEWSQLTAHEKKKMIFEEVFLQPKKMVHVIEAYRELLQPDCHFFNDPQYFFDSALDQIENMPLSFFPCADSLNASKNILSNFKEWVELHRGWEIFQDISSRKAEDSLQHLIHAVALMYCKQQNWDISPETDAGRGPEDFKISRGNDKTVIEVKLTSNNQCVHGLETQIEEYAKAEKTNNKIFVIVDNGENSDRVFKVTKKRKELVVLGKNPAEIFIVDAKKKCSASKA